MLRIMNGSAVSYDRIMQENVIQTIAAVLPGAGNGGTQFLAVFASVN